MSNTLVLEEYSKRYKFKSGNEVLLFIGKEGIWNQFILEDGFKVWAEVLDEDLNLLEEVEQYDKETEKITVFLNSLTGKKPDISYPQLPVITNKTPKPDMN